MPSLKLNDIPFRIVHVEQRQPACTGNIDRDLLCVIASATIQNLLTHLIKLFHFKGDVRKTPPVDRRWQRRHLFVVGKELDRWSVLSMAGNSQVLPLHQDVRDPRHCIRMRPLMIPLRTYRFTVEHLLVKVRQLAPILGNDVHMGITNPGFLAFTRCLASFATRSIRSQRSGYSTRAPKAPRACQRAWRVSHPKSCFPLQTAA